MLQALLGALELGGDDAELGLERVDLGCGSRPCQQLRVEGEAKQAGTGWQAGDARPPF